MKKTLLYDYFILCFTYLHLSCCGVRATNSTTHCQDPPDFWKRASKIMRRQSEHPAFHQLQKRSTGSTVDNHFVSVDDFFPEPDLRCPTMTINNATAGVNERSLCPWENVSTNRNPRRFPVVIPEARCLCLDCRFPGHHAHRHGSSSGLSSHTNLVRRTNCEAIYYPVQVMEQVGCRDGVNIYEYKWESVGVACICANARLTQQPRALRVQARGR
jgi:hypothetical protein